MQTKVIMLTYKV